MHRLIARMIFTTEEGSQSMTMVLNSTRLTNITTNAIIASSIPQIPEIKEPVRSDWQRQHDWSIGPAISSYCKTEVVNKWLKSYCF